MIGNSVNTFESQGAATEALAQEEKKRIQHWSLEDIRKSSEQSGFMDASSPTCWHRE